MNAADQEFERLMKLLGAATDAMRNGDGDAALMATAEALKTARRLPQKAICLPDRSNEGLS